MNKRKHDWKHFSRRTLSLILVLVTLVALCIPTGMALEDNAADETQPVAVQAAEPETSAEADAEAVVTSETDAQPVAETEPAAEVEQEQVTEPAAEPAAENDAEQTPLDTPASEPEAVEPTAEPAAAPAEEEQTSEPTTEAETVTDAASEPETTEEITTIDLDGNEADTLEAQDENPIAVQALTTIDVTITDDIKASGVLKVTVPSNVTLGEDVTYQWLKSSNKNNGFTLVTRKKVTGSSYNVTEYGDQVNVVLDDGAQKWYKVQAVNADGTVIATSDAYQVNYYKDVQNGSFEKPTPGGVYQQFANGYSNLIWKTTGSDQAIEIVKRTTSGQNQTWSGVQTFYGLKGNLPDGTQYAELNAEAYGTLYQDVLTTPYATLNWQLYHSARLQSCWYDNWYPRYSYYSGTDVMYVMIMSTVKAEELNIKSNEDVKAIVDAVNANQTTYNGVDLTGVSVNYVADGGTWNSSNTAVSRYYQTSPDGEKISTNNEWTKWTGAYRVPNGQYMTRFFFVSYASASGNQTVGNMLDDVKFTTDPLPPEKDRGNLTVTKTVVGLDDIPDDYTVTVSVTGLQDYTFTANEFLKQDDGTWKASYSYQNILAGNYTVTETASALTGYEWTADATSHTVTIRDQKTELVSFTNTYEQSTGTLVINKTITGLGADELAALKNTLTFTATATDGSDSFTFKLTDASVVDNGNGSYTFTKDGLKAGTTYTVTETEYDVPYFTRNDDPTETSATIEAGQSVTASFTNAYTEKMVNITIDKTLTENKNKTDGSFTFLLENKRTGITYTVTIVTGEHGYETITNIPAGEYTVTELDNDNFEHVGEYTITRDVVTDETFSFQNKGNGDSYQFSSSVVNKGTVSKGDTYSVKFEAIKKSTTNH